MSSRSRSASCRCCSAAGGRSKRSCTGRRESSCTRSRRSSLTTSDSCPLRVGSFVERFALGIDVKDHYLFYVAPLLFIATAAALEDPRPRLVGTLAVTAGFVLTVR